jgi:hypothetical protein
VFGLCEPPQLVDLAHLVGDLDLRLARDLLLDQAHREDRGEVLGPDRLLGGGMKRWRGLPGQVGQQIDPVCRDFGLGQQDFVVSPIGTGDSVPDRMPRRLSLAFPLNHSEGWQSG